MSKKSKDQARDEWNREGPRRDEARRARGIYHVAPDDVDHFNAQLTQAKQQYSIPEAAAMPVMPIALICRQAPKPPSAFKPFIAACSPS